MSCFLYEHIQKLKLIISYQSKVKYIQNSMQELSFGQKCLKVSRMWFCPESGALTLFLASVSHTQDLNHNLHFCQLKIASKVCFKENIASLQKLSPEKPNVKKLTWSLSITSLTSKIKLSYPWQDWAGHSQGHFSIKPRGQVKKNQEISSV